MMEGEHGTDRITSNFEAKVHMLRSASVLICALTVLAMLQAIAQQSTPGKVTADGIQGRVVDQQGKPVPDALVRLENSNRSVTVETKSDANGAFGFPLLPAGNYVVTARKDNWSGQATLTVAVLGSQNIADIVLSTHEDTQGGSAGSVGHAMEFSDEPKFSVAGVTDWTAVGGHGSDTALRTSEDLARDVLILKPEQTAPASAAASGGGDTQSEIKLRAALSGAPFSFEANHQLGEFYLRSGRYAEAVPLLESAYRIDPASYENTYDLALACEGTGDYSQARADVNLLLAHRDSAELHHLSGELDEKQGDPLAAVHEYELAVKENPSEQNYFTWGSELLLHRAIWQAQEVFRRGVQAYPQSERMMSAMAAALFAGAVYDEASKRICDASDLNPSDSELYTFMGKIDMAAPDPLPCIEARIARFARQQPQNPIANYLYAMGILKSQRQTQNPRAKPEAEALLKKAVVLDPRCAEAWLQLGILSYERHDLSEAMDDYRKAIEANPGLGEAHYRLGVAYDRTGESAKAKQEFELHSQIEKAQAEAVEQRRKEIRQFVIVPSTQATAAPK